LVLLPLLLLVLLLAAAAAAGRCCCSQRSCCCSYCGNSCRDEPALWRLNGSSGVLWETAAVLRRIFALAIAVAAAAVVASGDCGGSAVRQC